MLADQPPVRRGVLAARVGRATVERALRTGELVLVRRGVVAGRSCPRALAFSVLVQQARVRGLSAASHGTAAQLHQLDRLGRPPAVVRLLKPAGGAWRDHEMSVGVASLPPDQVTSIGGVPATTPARTVIDLARRASLASGVVLADSALRRGCPRAELERVLACCAEWPGSANAAAALALASPLAESVLESVSRVVFARFGLPTPDLQVDIHDADGFIGRVDFLWRDQRVIGEADGLAKYADIVDLHVEKLRQERLEQAGFRVVRWTWDDIWTRSEVTARRVDAALRGGRWLTAG